MHTVDQNIVDGLHAKETAVGSISSVGEEGVGYVDEVPSVESLSTRGGVSDREEPDATRADDGISPDGAREIKSEGVPEMPMKSSIGDDQPSIGGELPSNGGGQPFNGGGRPSAWDRDSFSYNDASDRDARKRTIMRELQECAPDVVRRYGLSVNTSSLQNLQYELEQFRTKQQLDTQVKFLELGLMALCHGIEFLNKRALQGFLALDGWGDNTRKSLGQFRSCLRRIAIRYFTTRSETSEIMELGMLLLGHMAWYHFQNASRPVWERVNGQKSRRRRKNRSKRRPRAGASDSKEAANEDGPVNDDDASSSSSESDDVDEDLEADEESRSFPAKPAVNLLGLLSKIVT